MFKKIAWNIFKQTGDINTMMESIEREKMSNVTNITNEKINETNIINNIKVKDDSIRLD